MHGVAGEFSRSPEELHSEHACVRSQIISRLGPEEGRSKGTQTSCHFDPPRSGSGILPRERIS